MDIPKTIHLYNLAHYNPLNPISAKHSIASDSVAYENGLKYPGADTHCDHCGVYLIPGLTCSSKIAFKKSKTKKNKSNPLQLQKQKRNSRTRVFQLTCLVCQYTKKSDALLNERANKQATVPVVQGKEEMKKKKRNRSELSILLEAKRNQAKQSASKSLSLQEFMQL